VSVQTARCIGACGLAPAVIYDGRVLARVTPDSLTSELEVAEPASPALTN
jgi:bidirectional [NiFe] hydrogenase diaphorase subunit